jgi:hypothetical protein
MTQAVCQNHVKCIHASCKWRIFFYFCVQAEIQDLDAQCALHEWRVLYCTVLYRPNCTEQHNTYSVVTGRSGGKNPVPLLNPFHNSLPLVPNLNPIYSTHNFGNPPNLVPGLQNGLFPSYIPD